MAPAALVLQPHPADHPGPPGLSLGGTLALQGPQPGQEGPPALQLELQLHCPAHADRPGAPLLLPAANQPGQRRDELWQHTCLECFLGVAGREPYWEINLAPNGDWNVYALDGYRQGLRPEPSLEQLPFSCSWQQSAGGALTLQLSLHWPLPPALITELALAGRGGQPAALEWAALEWNVTAVLEQPDGQLSYWAVGHRPEQPDFHWRAAWRRLRPLAGASGAGGAPPPCH